MENEVDETNEPNWVWDNGVRRLPTQEELEYLEQKRLDELPKPKPTLWDKIKRIFK